MPNAIKQISEITWGLECLFFCQQISLNIRIEEIHQQPGLHSPSYWFMSGLMLLSDKHKGSLWLTAAFSGNVLHVRWGGERAATFTSRTLLCQSLFLDRSSRVIDATRSSGWTHRISKVFKAVGEMEAKALLPSASQDYSSSSSCECLRGTVRIVGKKSHLNFRIHRIAEAGEDRCQNYLCSWFPPTRKVISGEDAHRWFPTKRFYICAV